MWAALACAAPQFAQTPAEGLTPAQLSARAKAQNVPEIPFESAPNFLKLPPNLYLGEGIGVATNSKGHIFVYTRSQATRLFEFDAKGQLPARDRRRPLRLRLRPRRARRSAGQHLGGGRRDEHGDQVQSRRPRRDGARPKAGAAVSAAAHRAASPTRFDRPTDVAWDAGGQHLRLRRLRQFARRQVRQERPLHRVRRHARAPRTGQLNLPHTIATDAKGNVYVGDRSNSRIQVFDNDLTFKAIYDQVGAPWAVCISPGPHQYLYSSNSNPDSNNSLICRRHRRDLQDGAGRHDPRQVRTRRQETGRVQHRARNRLPQRERTAGERDHRLARAEAHRCIRQGGAQ